MNEEPQVNPWTPAVLSRGEMHMTVDMEKRIPTVCYNCQRPYPGEHTREVTGNTVHIVCPWPEGTG